MGSGAGSNLLSGYLLTGINANTAALTNPQAAYGILGPGGNDSGGFAVEVRAFKAYKFQIVPTSATPIVGYSVSIFASVMPEVFQTYLYALQGRTPQGNSALPFGGSPNALADAASGFSPGIPAYAWQLLDGLSDQSGTGQSANPMTAQIPWFTGNGPVIGLRAVVTAAGSAGSFNVSVLGIP